MVIMEVMTPFVFWGNVASGSAAHLNCKEVIDRFPGMIEERKALFEDGIHMSPCYVGIHIRKDHYQEISSLIMYDPILTVEDYTFVI
jgi:hypothetical protein